MRGFGGRASPHLLPRIQLVIPALLLDELVVGATLDDAALLQHHDAVGVLHCAQPVGDDKGGAAGHQGVHALLDQGLGAGVDGGGGLVQNQHRRVRHGSPGDGQQLPLALAQVGAVPGEDCVVPVGQAADEAVGVGQLGRGDALLIGGVQAGYGVGFLPDVFPPWGCGCARVPLRGMEPASLGLYYRARQASAPLKALLRILRERDSRPKPRETMGKHRDI